jgi:hypothetical protein
MPSSHGCVPHTVSGLSNFMYFAHRCKAEEERARRRGHADRVTDTIPQSLEVSDTTVVPDTTRGTAPPVDTTPPVGTIPPVRTALPVGTTLPIRTALTACIEGFFEAEKGVEML